MIWQKIVIGDARANVLPGIIFLNFPDRVPGSNIRPFKRSDRDQDDQDLNDDRGHVTIDDNDWLIEPKDQEDEYFRNRFPHLEDIERDVNKI